MADTGEELAGRTGFEIAVIGMAGKFPGAKHIHEFWENIKNGMESITFLTDEELRKEKIDDESLKNPDYVRSKGAVLEGIEYFDAAFFDYIPDSVGRCGLSSRGLSRFYWNLCGCVIQS